MGDDYARAPESVPELETIRDVFAAGVPDGIGQIRNGVMAGILAEVIGWRNREAAEERHCPIQFGHVKEAEGFSRAQTATERMLAAFGEFHAALKEELGAEGEREIVADYLFGRLKEAGEEMLGKLAGTATEADPVIKHSATEPCRLPGRGDMARRDRSGG